MAQKEINRRIVQAQPRGIRRLGVNGDRNTNFTPGKTFANNGVLWAVIPVFGAATLTVRLKAATAGGTLDVFALGPDFDITQPQSTAYASLEGTIYTTGNPTQVAIVAGTENIITLNTLGEGFAIIKFTGGGSGTITYCDVMQSAKVQAP